MINRAVERGFIMEYDMSFFLTIASASASFVAIIGGFIASKLISINGERDAIVTRISEIDEEIEFRLPEKEELQESLDSDDAIDFIKAHTADVIAEAKLLDVYDNHSPQNIDIQTLEPYWNRAIELYEKFKTSFHDKSVNQEGLPIFIAERTRDNYFDYEVCRSLTRELSDNPTVWMMQYEGLSDSEINRKWYDQANSRFEQITREIELLELQKQQAEARKKALAKPKKMELGLYIFGGISIFNIFLPLLLCLLLPNYPLEIYKLFRGISLGFMSLGLILTFSYLFSLLDWNPKKK